MAPVFILANRSSSVALNLSVSLYSHALPVHPSPRLFLSAPCSLVRRRFPFPDARPSHFQGSLVRDPTASENPVHRQNMSSSPESITLTAEATLDDFLNMIHAMSKRLDALENNIRVKLPPATKRVVSSSPVNPPAAKRAALSPTQPRSATPRVVLLPVQPLSVNLPPVPVNPPAKTLSQTKLLAAPPVRPVQQPAASPPRQRQRSRPRPLPRTKRIHQAPETSSVERLDTRSVKPPDLSLDFTFTIRPDGNNSFG